MAALGTEKEKPRPLGHFCPGLTVVAQALEVVPPAGDRKHPDPYPYTKAAEYQFL